MLATFVLVLGPLVDEFEPEDHLHQAAPTEGRPFPGGGFGGQQLQQAVGVVQACELAGVVQGILLGEQAELVALMEAGTESQQPVELDQTRVGRLSRMDALQSQAMSIETDRRRQVELRRIEAAMERIAAGDFGYCVNCGEPIAAKRLDLDPTTPNCIACARAG